MNQIPLSGYGSVCGSRGDSAGEGTRGSWQDATAAEAQCTSITTGYPMTWYAALDAPRQIDHTRFICDSRPGGGPGRRDRLRVMPGSSLRLDARLSVKTDDWAVVYVTGNAIVSRYKGSFDRRLNGDVLTSADHDLVTAPTKQTSGEKSAGLNHGQCIGKFVEVMVEDTAHGLHDIFVVR